MGNGQSLADLPGSSVVSFAAARALTKKHNTPLLVCDLGRLKGNYKRLRSLFPSFTFYYAVKANPHPQILKTLVKLGSCFDVASKNEIQMCFDAGAEPEHLIYANPVKPVEHLRFAYQKGVRFSTYDNLAEVEKIAKYAPGSEVLLRIAVKDIGSVCKFSSKFGAKEMEAIPLLLKAKEMGLKPIGLSFHVGSQCMHIENFSKALDVCAHIFKRARNKGLDLRVLDTGGGIPIRYTEDVYSIESLAEVMHQKISELFPAGTRLISEPGRVLVGDTMTLLTHVIGVGKRGGKDCIYIDDGVYNSLSEKVFGHCSYQILSDKKGELRTYTVFGPTCDSMDVVSTNAQLPEMREGDLLLIPNTGAYTNAAATNFNGFEPAKIIFIG